MELVLESNRDYRSVTKQQVFPTRNKPSLTGTYFMLYRTEQMLFERPLR